jgi:hypothetical protein
MQRLIRSGLLLVTTAFFTAVGLVALGNYVRPNSWIIYIFVGLVFLAALIASEVLTRLILGTRYRGFESRWSKLRSILRDPGCAEAVSYKRAALRRSFGLVILIGVVALIADFSSPKHVDLRYYIGSVAVVGVFCALLYAGWNGWPPSSK